MRTVLSYSVSAQIAHRNVYCNYFFSIHYFQSAIKCKDGAENAQNTRFYKKVLTFSFASDSIVAYR